MSLPQEQTCKGCGLAVQPGYPRCPRCKMPMPRVQAPLATVTKPGQVQGGTAVVEESRSGLLLAAGGLLVVGGVVALLLLRGDGGEDGDESEGEAALEEVLAEEPELASPRSESPSRAAGIEVDRRNEGEDEEEKRRIALGDLEEALHAQRLWSTVSSSDSVVSVVSGACEQDEMKPALREAAGGLRAVGFTAIQCLAKHGALVFEQAL